MFSGIFRPVSLSVAARAAGLPSLATAGAMRETMRT